MNQLIGLGAHAIANLMQDMTIYFASFNLDGTSADDYSRLLSDLPIHRRAEILFSSLNYDCLLELAGSRLGSRIEYGTEPVVGNAMRVWKLHGSCNFIPEGIQATRGVSFGPGVTFDTGIKVVSPAEAIAWVRGNTALYAAMCLYAESKPINVGASVIRELQRRWAESVRRAQQVVVIGSRYHPEDVHLWSAITETPATVHVVGSQSTADRLRVVRTGQVRFVGSRFSSSVSAVRAILAGA